MKKLPTVVKVIIVYLLTWAAILFAAKSFGQAKDSTFVTVRLPQQSVRVKIPVRTVIVRDTLYLPCPESQPSSIRWSVFKGTFQQFVDSAAKAGITAIVDKDVTPQSEVNVPPIRMVAQGAVITNINQTLFNLVPGKGKHVFIGLVIQQQPSCFYAFLRKPISGAIFYDSIVDTKILGGRFGYMSSMGGNADTMSTTVMRNIECSTSYVNIHVYSQDGPYRMLDMSDARLSADSAHNVYAHPNVSIRFYNVVTRNKPYMRNGQPHSANSLQYFSSGNGERFEGRAKFFELRKCRSEPMQGYTGMWIVQGPFAQPAIVDSCDIAPYGEWRRVKVSNSNLVNAGQGCIINGAIDNCTGELWSGGDSTIVTNSRFATISGRRGGFLSLTNTTVQHFYFGDRGFALDVIANKSRINALQNFGNGNVRFRINESTVASQQGVPIVFER